MSKFIGRFMERSILLEALTSSESEFIAITGRRRVGKTFLIRHTYQQYITFEIVGIQEVSLQEQLANFYFAIRQYFPNAECQKPNSWLQAFEILIDLLETNKGKNKQVIFFDELPWMAGRKSGFIQGLSFFWNTWASKNNVLFVGCGSATSWIVDKILLNKGGLHNRVTRHIQLQPFTLRETEQYLEVLGVRLSKYQIAQLYMIVGGIPYYLRLVPRGKSISQIVHSLFFDQQASLKNEFRNLYAALFLHSEKYIKIIEACNKKRSGITLNELIALSGLSSGGALTKMVEDLVLSGFIIKFDSYVNKKKNQIIRLVDEYSIFYLKFIKNNAMKDWSTINQSNSYTVWTGFAFENLCLKHVKQIKMKLGISGVISRVSTYYEQGNQSNKGVQIDLIIDRDDQVVNLCEMKFYNRPFVISKSYFKQLSTKIDKLHQVSPRRKTIHLTLVTTFGLKENKYSSLVQSQVVLDDLFV